MTVYSPLTPFKLLQYKVSGVNLNFSKYNFAAPLRFCLSFQCFVFVHLPPSVFVSFPSLSLSQGQLTNSLKHLYRELLQGFGCHASYAGYSQMVHTGISQTCYTPELFTLLQLCQRERERERVEKWSGREISSRVRGRSPRTVEVSSNNMSELGSVHSHMWLLLGENLVSLLRGVLTIIQVDMKTFICVQMYVNVSLLLSPYIYAHKLKLIKYPEWFLFCVQLTSLGTLEQGWAIICQNGL